MIARALVFVGVGTLTLFMPRPAEDRPKKAAEFQIEARLYQGDPLGSVSAGTIKIVHTPRLRVLNKQPAYCHLGSQYYMIMEGAYRNTQNLSVIAQSAADNKIRLEIHADITDVYDNNAEQTVIRSDASKAVKDVKPGEAVRLRVGPKGTNQTWWEFKVTEITPSG